MPVRASPAQPSRVLMHAHASGMDMRIRAELGATRERGRSSAATWAGCRRPTSDPHRRQDPDVPRRRSPPELSRSSSATSAGRRGSSRPAQIPERGSGYRKEPRTRCARGSFSIRRLRRERQLAARHAARELGVVGVHVVVPGVLDDVEGEAAIDTRRAT